ncbi:hypothetical protein ACXZ9C_10665 [Streptococcus agalactiae]
MVALAGASSSRSSSFGVGWFVALRWFGRAGVTVASAWRHQFAWRSSFGVGHVARGW